MILAKPERKDIERIVSMSIRAFESDNAVAGRDVHHPPEYDSLAWHEEMFESGNLYQAVEENEIVGAAILFYHESVSSLYIGRIFIDPAHHRKGCGIALMECIEKLYPDVKEMNLETPLWNSRTNSFYQKLGYHAVKQENNHVYYQKKLR